MSLVNDMLRDLDKRKSLSGSSSRVRALLDVDHEEEKSKPWLLVIMMLSGIALGLGAGIYFYSNGLESNSNLEQFQLLTEEQTFEIKRTEISARVESEIETATGQEYRFTVSKEVELEVLSKDETSINLLFKNVEKIDSSGKRLPGVSMYPTSEGLHVSVDAKQTANFLVFDDVENELFTVVIEAVWNDIKYSNQPGLAINTSIEESSLPRLNAKVEEIVNPRIENQELPELTSAAVQSPPVNVTSVVNQSPRIIREQSIEQLDIVNSQDAVKKIQRGDIISAYEGLFRFIDAHPNTHHSRQTLASLLFSQQEYQQVEQVIDQGMALSPNNSTYKKIKARLLMNAGQNKKAVDLLDSSPPPLSEDSEYFELLASVYQQTGKHINAIETYQDLLRKDGQKGKWWAGMAISLEAEGNVEDAVASFQTALRSVELDQGLRQYSQSRVRNLSSQL